MYLSPHPHLDCLPRPSQPPGITIRTNPRPLVWKTTTELRIARREDSERGEMSICVALSIMLGRGIQALYIDIKKKREIKQQQKREQQRLSEQPHISADIQPSIQSDRGEYQHLDDHGHREEQELRNSADHDHRRDGQNNLSVVPRPLAWLEDIEVDPLDDILPAYDQDTAQLPAYDHIFSNSSPRRGRRRNREGSRPHGEASDGNRGRINEPHARARACTGIRISECAELNVDHGVGETVIWYDALEDRYEVITRSLASPTGPPLPPPYMPNSCIMYT